MGVEIIYPMGDHPLLWDEFNPNLYTMEVQLSSNGKAAKKKINFGMRKIFKQGTRFAINGRLTFLRGTLECAIFPKTGYPPIDIASWMRIFKICRSYGLNHIRFHSWSRPKLLLKQLILRVLFACRMGFVGKPWRTIGDGNHLTNIFMMKANAL